MGKASRNKRNRKESGKPRSQPGNPYTRIDKRNWMEYQQALLAPLREAADRLHGDNWADLTALLETKLLDDGQFFMSLGAAVTLRGDSRAGLAEGSLLIKPNDDERAALESVTLDFARDLERQGLDLWDALCLYVAKGVGPSAGDTAGMSPMFRKDLAHRGTDYAVWRRRLGSESFRPTMLTLQRLREELLQYMPTDSPEGHRGTVSEAAIDRRYAEQVRTSLRRFLNREGQWYAAQISISCEDETAPPVLSLMVKQSIAEGTTEHVDLDQRATREISEAAGLWRRNLAREGLDPWAGIMTDVSRSHQRSSLIRLGFGDDPAKRFVDSFNTAKHQESADRFLSAAARYAG